MNRPHAHILLSPRITEKGSDLSAQGIYVFNVAKDADRREIAEAIQAIYKVTPRSVRLIAIPSKRRLTRGTNRMGATAAGKKAYVHLKKGDTIELV